MVFEFLRKKKKKEIEEPAGEPIEEGLPEDLEQFRMKPAPEEPSSEIETPLTPSEFDRIERKSMPSYEPLGRKTQPEEIPRTSDDKMELILSKLDTIDARLRFIEEKLHKRERSYL